MVEKIGKDLNIIGIIHARGGSKRIPLKNIEPLNGRPLISYMIREALGSRYLRRVIVSTDHPEIKKISLEYGAEVPFTRPKELAEDCPSEWVTQQAVEFVESEESRKVDIAVTMQPTTPFCTALDIDTCIESLLTNDEMTSAFTAKVVRERPEWMFRVTGKNRASLLLDGDMKGERGIFQSLQRLVIPNGAVYATRRNTLFHEGVIISKNTVVHVMPDERSVDIDEPIDLLFAEFLLKQKENKDEQVPKR
jgi:CMP-N,N'-diacetyllegionaminic acid synthase